MKEFKFLEDDDIFDLIEASMLSFDERKARGPTPAWAILLDPSPENGNKATSWFGGSPSAPPEIRWPRNSNDVPMIFVAQIDLSALTPVPHTGQRPKGLPSTGALLIFIGGYDEGYRCEVVPPEEERNWRRMQTPDDAPLLRDHGFYREEISFPRWPLRFVPYLSDIDDTEKDVGLPPSISKDYSRPDSWRRHRLFGMEPPFPNNDEDLRGYACLISIASDKLLGTDEEHQYGFSIWCKFSDLATGNLNSGCLVFHCAV